MKVGSSIKKQIDESRYLSAENTWRYRTIIRFMYKSYEKMKYWLYKEEVFDYLKNYDEFEEYTLDNVKNDLDALVNWRNLLAVADTTKVRSIDEFKNREFRYQLSQNTIEIERMLINIENMSIENTSSLEHSLVEKFREQLEKFHETSQKEDSEVYDWWKKLNNSFKDLNENYQDYVSEFYSPKTEELMKTTEFLMFKEGFTKYLRDFIRTLQINSFTIKGVIQNIKEDEIDEIINKVWNHEKTIPNLENNINYEAFFDIHRGRFQSIKEWFLSYNGKEPLIEQLISNTNDIIRKITRFASQIADKRNNSANRKEEYRKIARMFSKCRDINEANKLSSLVFGVFSTRHIKGEEYRITESINSSIYDEEPTVVVTKPRIRTYREKIIKNPIVDKSLRKKENLDKLLIRRKKEKQLMERFIVNSEIDFSQIKNITTFERGILLRWLSKGKASKSCYSKTEFGKRYRVEEPSSKNCIKLDCEDGVFSMPHYILKFEEEE